METESAPASPKLPSPALPRKPGPKNRPMPLSKKKQEVEEPEPLSQKRKLDETEKDEVTEPAPAKKKCLPLSIKKKLEEAERLKQKEAEVLNSSSPDSSDSEVEGPSAKKNSLFRYFNSVKGTNNLK